MKYLIQSLATFLGLYGLVFAVADALYFQRSISPTWIVALAGTLVTLQYLLSPWFIRNLLNIDWDDDGSALPARNRQFLEQLCARHGLTVPQIGVIHASMPNAFAFGRTRSDAGIVVTSSLLERLTPDEVNAVIAHELGHIKNWDFLAMTLAALAPLLLYQLYSFARRGKEEHWATWASYAAYWVAEFLVLSLSRTREYAADHFAAQSTGQPGLLASALIKIGYGIGLAEHELAGAAKSEDEGVKANAVAQRRISGTIGVLGISNGNGALALSGLAPGAAGSVMLWDMVNPWALVYEIGSTHPLMAHRVDALNRQAQQLGQPVEYPVPRAPMQWGRFPLELFLWAAPWTLFAALSIITALHRVQLIAAPHLLGETIVFAFLATWIARIWYRYQTPFAPATFAALLANTSVSNIRPIAVRVEAEILGPAEPEAFWSPDLMLRDETGRMFLLDRQSIPLMRLINGLQVDDLTGQRVVVRGWYRRGPIPYLEMSSLQTADGQTRRSWSRWIQAGLAFAATAFLLWQVQRWPH